MNDLPLLMIVRLGLSAILIVVGFYDLLRKQVPNPLVAPLVAGTMVLDAARLVLGELALDQVALVTAAWAMCLFLWWARALGGGDVKLLMALTGLFPDKEMMMTLVAVLLFGHVLVLIRRDGWKGLPRLWGFALVTLKGSVPNRAEIRAVYEARRTPVTWLISLAGVIYLWLMLGQ